MPHRDDSRAVAALATRQNGNVTHRQLLAAGLSRDGIVVHRQPLAGAHATTHHGVPVTTPIRTLLDLAAVAPLGVLFRAFEQAQVRLHVPPAPLAAEVISRR